MSYYASNHKLTRPGMPFEIFSPIPGWQMNPYAAGNARVGIGATGYEETGWGMVALVGAGTLLTGLFVGHAVGKRSTAKKFRSNRRRQLRRLGS